MSPLAAGGNALVSADINMIRRCRASGFLSSFRAKCKSSELRATDRLESIKEGFCIDKYTYSTRYHKHPDLLLVDTCHQTTTSQDTKIGLRSMIVRRTCYNNLRRTVYIRNKHGILSRSNTCQACQKELLHDVATYRCDWQCIDTFPWCECLDKQILIPSIGS